MTILRDFVQCFHKGDRRKPAPARPPDSFFRSAETMVYKQVHSILNHSLREYLSLFNHPLHLDPTVEASALELSRHAPRFMVRLWLNAENSIEFDPPLPEITEAVIEALSYVVRTLESLPRIANVVFGPGGEVILNNPAATGVDILKHLAVDGSDEMKIVLEDGLVEKAGEQLEKYSTQCFGVVKEYVKKYQSYEHIYTHKVDAEVDAFMAEEHTFEEYTVVRMRSSRAVPHVACTYIPATNRKLRNTGH